MHEFKNINAKQDYDFERGIVCSLSDVASRYRNMSLVSYEAIKEAVCKNFRIDLKVEKDSFVTVELQWNGEMFALDHEPRIKIDNE